MERLDNLNYQPAEHASTIEGVETDLFLTGPQEFLIRTFCDLLKAQPLWLKLFGDNIDPYMRMDYSARNFPSMRVYCDKWGRNFETWYNNGDLQIDIIWPASIRRTELQQIPMTIASALEQQLSSPKFFEALCAKVPGLNEFGKRLDVDMSKFFSYGEDDAYPFTRLKVGFRIDLAAWARYLESDNRTKDEPFQRTLKDLRLLVGVIEGLRSEDPDAVDVTVGIQQSTNPDE